MTVEQAQPSNPTVASVMRPLSDAAGWMKLIGTLAIIYGVILALTIVGLIIAWLPIWMGLLLRRSAEESVAAHRTGSETHAISATTSLHTFFKVQGVLVLIGLVIAGVAIIVAVFSYQTGGGTQSLGAVSLLG